MEKDQQVAQHIQVIARRILQSFELDLIEVTCSGRGAETVLRVFIDKPGGVQLADCEHVHKSLGYALDIEDPIPHAYTLEVSSPGVDRPFANREQYEPWIGRAVSVTRVRPHLGRWKTVGKLVQVGEGGVTLDCARKPRAQKLTQIPWDDIKETRAEIQL